MHANLAHEVPKFTSGTQNSTPFNAAGRGAINLTGRAQIRLRFEANQTATRYLWVGSGTQATLELEYEVP